MFNFTSLPFILEINAEGFKLDQRFSPKDVAPFCTSTKPSSFARLTAAEVDQGNLKSLKDKLGCLTKFSSMI
jgi:hypothetical protein